VGGAADDNSQDYSPAAVAAAEDPFPWGPPFGYYGSPADDDVAVEILIAAASVEIAAATADYLGRTDAAAVDVEVVVGRDEAAAGDDRLRRHPRAGTQLDFDGSSSY